MECWPDSNTKILGAIKSLRLLSGPVDPTIKSEEGGTKIKRENESSETDEARVNHARGPKETEEQEPEIKQEPADD